MDRKVCENIAELISAYADNEVTPEERALVQTHLLHCSSCAARLADYQGLHADLHQYLASIPVPPLRQSETALRSGRTIEAKGRGMKGDSVRSTTPTRAVPTLALAVLATAAVLIAIFLAAGYFGGAPRAVQALDILDKAARVASDPGTLGVQSVEMTRSFWAKRIDPRLGPAGEVRSELHLWWQAPNRWRMEFRQTEPASAAMSEPNVNVSDGQTVWESYGGQKMVTINNWEPGMDIIRGFLAVGTVKMLSGAESADQLDLASLLKDARQCYDPKLLGEDTVAGRPAYVIDLGPSRCPSASAVGMNGRQVIWVDKETFFGLKSEQYSQKPEEGLIAAQEVTSVRYNSQIDASLFTFVPPAGAIVRDYRPKPAPTASEFQSQLQALAQQVDFPVFVPQRVPGGLQPRQPRLDPEFGLELAYVPSEEVEQDSPASRNGLSIVQLRATYDLVSRWTESAETVRIGAASGWVRRGFRDVKGGGSDSAAMVVRDGTMISVSSFGIAPEELIAVAASLQPVPGGHEPLPNPVAPSIDEIRQRASFKVLLPGYVPAGLKPEPPVPGQQAGSDRIEAMNIIFHNADGAAALKLTESPPREPSSMAMPMLSAPEVVIKDGIIGHLMEAPSAQTSLLWWEQEGTFVALETRVLPKEELLRIAASMSATASLGETELPITRPTPTPVPAPKFTILRPTWLPEPMTVREQYEAGPEAYGSSVIIGFDPRPNDREPHSVLLLTERPKAMVGSKGQPDPQEIHENIGGHEVTIIKRGDNCITYWWEVGEVALSLTNPYDPPGHPRYSCDELRRVVESIR